MIDFKVICIIGIILGFYSALLELYKLIREGKLIVNTQKNVMFIDTIMAVGTTILSGILTISNIVSYLNNEKVNGEHFLQQMLLVQFGVYVLLRARRYSGIKKNGISVQYGEETYFYKWNKIKCYKWIDEDEFQFEVLQKNNPTIYKNMEIGIHEQQEVDEVLQSYILKI